MSANTKARSQKLLLFLGTALAHVIVLLLLARIVVFPAAEADNYKFMGVKIAPLPQRPVMASQPASPLPILEWASGSSTLSGLPQASPPIRIVHTIDDILIQAINSGIENNRGKVIGDITKNRVDQQISGTGNVKNIGDDSVKNTGVEMNDDNQGPLFCGDIFKNEKIAIIIEGSPFVFNTRYLPSFLNGKKSSLLNAALIVAFTAKEKTVSDTKPWTPLPNRAVTPDPQNGWVVEQELDVKAPDIFSYDLYDGVNWAINHQFGSIIIISGFKDGDSPAMTQSVITAMRSAHIHLFLISVLKDPYVGLLDYALESGGQGIINTSSDGAPYRSDEWMHTTKIITRNGTAPPRPSLGHLGSDDN